MRILWFTNTPSLYKQKGNSNNGGGWIQALEEIINKENDIELAISFFHSEDSVKLIQGSTVYYPILKRPGRYSPIKSILNNWKSSIESEEYISKLISVIKDFKPDLIHVFGTEGVFASLNNHTDIPIIIHLQGLINPCLNAFFSPSQSKYNFIFNPIYLKEHLLGRSIIFSHKRFFRQAIREKNHLLNTKYIMGRTDWDHSISRIYAPNSIYFHVDEVLRSEFYNVSLQKYSCESITIITTISETTYKGIDVVLKTAALLKETTNIIFEWKIIGITSESKLLRHFENDLNINHKEVNIECLGLKSAKNLVAILSTSDIFIHPSYIDNSPNSVCEAQLVGLPVIACNVGGLSSLIQHEKTGILVPSNGVFEIVYTLIDFNNNRSKYKIIADNGKKCASIRHDKLKILQNIKSIYNSLINN